MQLNIDTLVRAGAIQPGACVGGEMKFKFYDDELAINSSRRRSIPERLDPAEI